MDTKIISLIPLSLLTVGAIEKPSIDPTVPIGILNDANMRLDPIGPCEKYGEDINLTGTIVSITGISNIRERLSIGPKGGNYTYFYTTAKHNITKGDIYSLSLPMPIHSVLGENGIDCKVQIIDLSNKEIDGFTFSLNPITKERINVNDYIRTTYSKEDIVVDPDDYQNKKTEQYRFYKFLDYFNEDNYYRLNLNKLKLTYSCAKPFPGCNAKLKFTDFNNVFPLINGGRLNTSFEIPLRYTYASGVIAFDFPEQMYVNPKTLEMSLNARPEFRITKYFYLPINKKDLLLDQTFSLEVTNFGHNKTSFSWDITYLNNRNLLGDCDNSDYCVVGEFE